MQKRRSSSKPDSTDAGSGDASESVDRYERSSERRSASSKSSRFGRSDKARADAKSFASARRISGRADDEGVTHATESRIHEDVGESDRTARLERARMLLKQATAQPNTDRVSNPAEPAPRIAEPEPDPFEDADPFEPFEQCAPATPAREETVYSRSSQRTRKTSASEANNPRRPQRSLKGRALAYLSRREYSRAELSRKLRPYVEEADSLETLLDGLERDGWLSNERFVESVVHRRAPRMGGGRIISELKRHAVGDTLIGETADKLAQSETARAQAVWEKKYGVLPETPAERAKQARFLASRGFTGGTIGKILKGGEEDWTDEPVDD